MFSRRVLPRRIILVRHGESEGNVDESMYCRVPDPKISLTDTVRSLLLSPAPLPRGTSSECGAYSGLCVSRDRFTHTLGSTRRSESPSSDAALRYSVSLSRFAQGTSTAG